jgi:hypothetical protein
MTPLGGAPTFNILALSGSQSSLTNDELRRFVNSHGYVVPEASYQY